MRYREQITGQLPGHWKTGGLKSASQLDGNSCGAFVLLVIIKTIVY